MPAGSRSASRWTSAATFRLARCVAVQIDPLAALESRAMRLPAIFRTSVFQLTILYIVLFGVSVATLGWFIYRLSTGVSVVPSKLQPSNVSPFTANATGVSGAPSTAAVRT